MYESVKHQFYMYLYPYMRQKMGFFIGSMYFKSIHEPSCAFVQLTTATTLQV